MKPYETAMNQYESLKGWLAHYNQILRSKPTVDTRHRGVFQSEYKKGDRDGQSQRKEKNHHMLDRLISIRHRPRKSMDDSSFNKTSLKNEFKEKEKWLCIQKDNVKMYQKLKSAKSCLKNIERLNQFPKKSQRFSQTLHYQGQVYKTFTNFLGSNNQPKMYLRTEKDHARKEKPLFKVEVVEILQEPSKTKSRKKGKKRLRRKSKDIEDTQVVSAVL